MNIRIPALFAVVLPSMFAIAGCKSQYEKYADESCACKDAACIKAVSESHKDMLGGEKTSLKELDAKINALPEKDKKEFQRGFECMMKIAMADAPKDQPKEEAAKKKE
jgi:hypothetical protein